MTFDREDFVARTQRKAPPDDRRNLQMIQQAAVSAEALTGDAHWDKFLQYLQAALESNARQRDAYMNELANPLLVNADEVQKRRIAVMRLNERIEVLSFVMQMPTHLIRLGASASATLKTLPDMELTP
jgi:hypothetical protein